MTLDIAAACGLVCCRTAPFMPVLWYVAKWSLSLVLLLLLFSGIVGAQPCGKAEKTRAQALIMRIDMFLHAVRRSPCVQTSLLVIGTVISPSARHCIDVATHFTISNMQSRQRATTNRYVMLTMTNICKRQLSAARRSPCGETAQTLKSLLAYINTCSATQ